MEAPQHDLAPSRSRRARQLAVACAVFLSSLLVGAAETSRDKPPPDIVYPGDAACTRCHDEEEGPKVLSIGKTRHGVVADRRAPNCTACHGESQAHVDYKGSATPPKPERYFSRHAKLSAEEMSAACLSCHQGGKRMNWHAGAHATREVACTACHEVHAPSDKVQDKRAQAGICYTCHKQQRAEMSRPSHHPVPEGKMACSDCHNAHGSAGQKMLVKDTTNATCFTCHAEKRGPFLHNHQPVVEDCANCHNPHGTTADAMLKTRMPFLCQQCHGNASHPGNVPAVRSNMPNALSANIGPGMAQARGCSNCHTNIHGSNNPSKATSSGAYRFFR